MKNLFGEKKRLFVFTEKLSELVSSGVSLQKSLSLLEKIRFRDSKVNAVSAFLYCSLLDGTKFSSALKMAPFITVPVWYVAFIGVAEECGCLPSVLLHLKELLKKENEAREKIFVSLVYPVLVIFLTAVAGFYSVFCFLPSFSQLFAENFDGVKNEAVKSLFFADIFLVISFFLLMFSVKKCLSPSPCANVLRTMAFLGGKSVPTLQAVSCAFFFTGRDKKLSFALLCIQERLLQGEKIAECFGRCFLEAGFYEEGLILSENLCIDEECGKNRAFESTADFLAAKSEKRQKVFLSALQPLLLLVAAIYITFILKTAFLPYLTNFGGLV